MPVKPRVLPVKCQRPVDYKESAIKSILERVGYVYVEPKYDGFRCHIVVKHDKVYALTREGIELTAITDRARALFGPYLRANSDYAFDCEVVLPGYKFEEMSGLLRRDAAIAEDVKVCFYIFDYIPLAVLLGGEGQRHSLRGRSYPRMQACAALHKFQTSMSTYKLVNCNLCNSLEDIANLFTILREHGFEGAVVKDPSQVYQNSKVNGWFKMKPSVTHDGKITGFVDGTNSNKGKLVGFVVLLEDGAECRATGLTQVLIKAVTANPAAFLGRLVEVSGMEATTAGNVRHPKFKCFRDSEASPGVKI